MDENVKIGPFILFDLNTPSCRAFSGLSESHKIMKIGQAENKLWSFQGLKYTVEGDSLLSVCGR